MLTDYQRYRFYEMLPGLSVWLSFLLAIVLSVIKPLWMIYFVIVFDIYWVIRVANFAFYLIVAWRRFRRAQATDWKVEMETLDNWKDKKHVVFLTLYNETWDVVQTAMQSLREATYDARAFVVVIAGEERAKANFEKIFEKTKAEFGHCFLDVVGVLHPSGLSEEIPGKGSNLHYAERHMKKYIDDHGWAYETVIATIFDIDTVCHKHYFSYLTYLYCTHPKPTHSSFQPIAMYNNNMWDSPAMLRIMAFGTTFWMMTSLARQDALVTFSSHSMSFRAVVDAGFHDKRIVSEDSRMFYQCLLANNGDYEVTPMYIPVSMDTVRDDQWWQSIKNLYKQQRRWAWGVEHVPYLLWNFRKKKALIPFWIRVKWVFVEWEGKWSWALVALILTFLGRLPLWLAPDAVKESALVFNAPHLLQILMTMALLGLFLSAILSFPLLPQRPDSHPAHRYVMMLLQWALLPITMLVLSAVPAIDAVTHLMFGRYLGFNVSQKKRATSIMRRVDMQLGPTDFSIQTESEGDSP